MTNNNQGFRRSWLAVITEGRKVSETSLVPLPRSGTFVFTPTTALTTNAPYPVYQPSLYTGYIGSDFNIYPMLIEYPRSGLVPLDAIPINFRVFSTDFRITFDVRPIIEQRLSAGVVLNDAWTRAWQARFAL